MYLPSHAALGNHPKLRRLARTLNISRPAAVGHLHYLWWWSQEYAPDGDLSYQRYTAEDIADAALWDGDAYAFVDALKTSGFVDDVDGRLLLHDWEEYGGKIVIDLAKDRERKRGKGNPQSSTAVPKASTGIPPEFHRNSGVDKIKREERREEERERVHANGHGQPEARAPTRRMMVIPDPFVVTDELTDWVVEHGMPKKWALNRIESFISHYSASTTLATREGWYDKCRKWLLDDWAKDRTSGLTAGRR